MSAEQQVHFFDKLLRAVAPASDRDEPAVWFRELRILDELSADPLKERRRMVLHRGFNVLWAAPEDPDTEQGLYRDGLAGHASGKTLFCRILRHLLGEKPFGTAAQRSGISSNFLSLWAVAAIRVGKTSWVVGRPLAAAGNDFAVKADIIDAVLTGGQPLEAGFAEYLTQVRSIGSDVDLLYPDEGWRHLLPWLARDQEARFSSLAAWREATSEGDNPMTRVIERHQLMRAVLGLLDLKEPALRKKLDHDVAEQESGKLRLVRLESELAGQVALASARAADVLGSDLPTEHDALLLRLNSLSEVIRQAVADLEKRPEPATVIEARRKHEAARDTYHEADGDLRRLGPQIAALKERQARDLTIIRNIKTGNIEDPAREAAGMCPHTIQTAERRKCVIQGTPSAESATSIAELEAQAAKDLEEISRVEELQQSLLKDLPKLRQHATDTETSLAAALREGNREVTSLIRRAERVEEIGRLFKQTETTKKLHQDQIAALEKLIVTVEARKAEIAKLRGEMDNKLDTFSCIFADIIRAVMGASVEPKISVTSDGIVPHVTRKGELSGAALDTIKTLAFDLAAIVTSIEGQGSHPRLLIHDGPREGDMARIIYERFFLYAAGIENAFTSPDQASFQYIITTTTPPPKSMREGSRWLLDPVLDSRTKDRRLLREDF